MLLILAIFIPLNSLIRLSNNWMNETNRLGWEMIAKKYSCVAEIYELLGEGPICAEARLMDYNWTYRSNHPPNYVLWAYKILMSKYDTGRKVTW